MEEQLLMAYRVVEINHIVYIVVFPIPDQKEIEKKNFKYPDYIKGLLTKLKESSREERIKILNEWSAPKEIHPYDIALGRIQIAYEQALRTEVSEEMLPDIYTEQMKQVIEEYKTSYETALAIQQEETLKKKFEEIKKTSQERFASFLAGTTEVKNLYLYDLKKMNKNPEHRRFKRMFCAHLDMGIQDELTELELETMTLQEIWIYNKSYLVRKEEKHAKRKAKSKKACQSNKKVV